MAEEIKSTVSQQVEEIAELCNRDFYLFQDKNSSVNLHELETCSCLSVDVETTGLDIASSTPIGAALSPSSSFSCYFERDEIPRELIEKEGRVIIAHNAKFDRSMLKKIGIQADNFYDTMVAAQLLGESQLGLHPLSIAWLGIPTHGVEIDYVNASLQEMGDYCGKHALATYRLWELMKPALHDYKLEEAFYEYEMPLIPIISDMESHGTLVDLDELKRLENRFRKKLDEFGGALKLIVGRPLNPNSPKQVSDYLFNELKLPVRKRTKTNTPSTNSKDVLDHMRNSHPSIPLIIAFREFRKLLTDYAVGLQKAAVDGRIHTSFNQCGTRTGRWSSSGPNLQNVPMRKAEGRQIRKAFIAPLGHSLIRTDWDQLELRVTAHFSGDEGLIKAFRSGGDVHLATALDVFGDASRRRDAKNLNFLVVYGGGAAKAAEVTHMSVKEAKVWIAKYFEKYPRIETWWVETRTEARRTGFVRTLSGRMREFPELLDNDAPAKVHEAAEREAINTRIQGSAADIVKAGMIRLYKELKHFDAKMILQVHDEIVLEVPDKEVKEVVDIIKRVLPTDELSVPLSVSVEVGPNWRDVKEI